MIHSKKYTDAARGKITPRTALDEVERDDIGKCAHCSDLALEGERLCMCCKSYQDDIDNGIFEVWDDAL